MTCYELNITIMFGLHVLFFFTIILGVMSDTEDNGMPQSITTTARSGQVTRTNANFFEPL